MNDQIEIKVRAEYLEEQSRPQDEQYVFGYRIEIANQSEHPVTLKSRYWHIVDAEQQVQEVEGEGVVGEQPTLAPGEAYAYTSGAVVKHPPATMEGHYIFDGDNGQQFQTAIPAFSLALPHSLH